MRHDSNGDKVERGRSGKRSGAERKLGERERSGERRSQKTMERERSAERGAGTDSGERGVLEMP